MKVATLSLCVLSAGSFAAALPIAAIGSELEFPGITIIKSFEDPRIDIGHIDVKRDASPQEPPIDMHPPPPQLNAAINAYTKFYQGVADTLNIPAFLAMFTGGN
ncbi:hypothetical protein ABW21_db0208710 [Orbilia brochopaga]|nr:hypothetical protein ABW21_db0208710 [Drechslerella brochopaga]